jgi:nicotinamide riboside kinase
MKFAFTGPESSGKTTLSKAIAEKIQANYYPEFSREYLNKRNGTYTKKDLDEIALGQFEFINQIDKKNQVYDTEMLVIQIWSEFKYHSCSELILNLVQQQQIDHYFLCSPDIPYEEDPLRECPEQRDELFDIYLNKLKTYKVPFSIIKGTPSERIEKTLEIILNLLK